MKYWLAITLLLTLTAGLSERVFAQPSPMIIGNLQLSTGELPLNKARSIFSMRLREWPDGTPVRVYVLPDGSQSHRQFVQSVLGMFPHQLRRNWDRYIYTGTGQAPTEVNSEEEMIERVRMTPGAIGYSSKEVMHDEVRILQLL